MAPRSIAVGSGVQPRETAPGRCRATTTVAQLSRTSGPAAPVRLCRPCGRSYALFDNMVRQSRSRRSSCSYCRGSGVAGVSFGSPGRDFGCSRRPRRCSPTAKPRPSSNRPGRPAPERQTVGNPSRPATRGSRFSVQNTGTNSRGLPDKPRRSGDDGHDPVFGIENVRRGARDAENREQVRPRVTVLVE
jgi:hypothetical protein